jgi:O-antigen/teichoic acid export membrane protein
VSERPAAGPEPGGGGGDSSEAPGELRRRAAGGARWTSVSAAVSVGLQIAQLVVLARLLDPREFGLAASAMVVLGLTERISEAGITNAIIAKKTTDRDVLSSLYWANILIGGAFALAMVAVIPAVTSFFDQPDLAELLLLGAPALLIAPFGQLYGALLARELDFKPLAGIEVTAAVAGTAAAIAAAAAGVGAAALILGWLTQAATRSIALAVRGWSIERPRRRLRRDDLHGYLSFGAYQIGERVANYLGSNLDYALIGAYIGQAALGIYSVAFRLITVPQMKLNPVLTRVAYPVFALRSHDDAALRRGFLELSRAVAFVSFPLMAGLAVVAPQFVPVAFGPQWEESIPILQILTILGVLFSLGNLNGSVFLAKNRPDLGLKLNLTRLAIIVVAFAITFDGGLEAVAWAFVAAALAMMLILRGVMYRLIGLTLRAYLGALLRPALIAGPMAAVVLAVTPGLESLFDADAAVLAGQILVAAVSCAAFAALFARTELKGLWALVAARKAAA